MRKPAKTRQIAKLAKRQKDKIEVFRHRYYDLAASTVTDLPKAEAAIRELLGLVRHTSWSIVWANSPEEAKKIWDSEGNTELLYSLRVSLRNSLQDSVQDSLLYSLWYELRNSTCGSLRDSLQDSLSYSLWNSLWHSLRYSLSDSLQDSGLVCFYTYCRDVLGVQYDSDANTKLDLFNKLLESCFGVWVVPGKIVLLEKPAAVEIQGGKVACLTWSQNTRAGEDELPWTGDMSRLSRVEGWDLFVRDDGLRQIERFDDSDIPFRTDDEAIMWVRDRASGACSTEDRQRYALALRIHDAGASLVGKPRQSSLPPSSKEQDSSLVRIAAEVGRLVEEKQKAYGDSFGRSGDVLRVLYSNGVKPEQYTDMLAVVRIIDKLFRISNQPDAFQESPGRDIAGYGVLIADSHERAKGA